VSSNQEASKKITDLLKAKYTLLPESVFVEWPGNDESWYYWLMKEMYEGQFARDGIQAIVGYKAKTSPSDIQDAIDQGVDYYSAQEINKNKIVAWKATSGHKSRFVEL
jgi:beta-glucanase (GH16 family)